ncbi:hypothetical protein D3C80_1622650 [compost metagenome]
MTIQAEAHTLIVEAIDRLPNKRAVAKQLFDAIRPRDGDIAREAQAKLAEFIGEIWRQP